LHELQENSLAKAVLTTQPLFELAAS